MKDPNVAEWQARQDAAAAREHQHALEKIAIQRSVIRLRPLETEEELAECGKPVQYTPPSSPFVNSK
jgi:hypothetical protein